MGPPAQVMAAAPSVAFEANSLRLTEMQIAELREAFQLFDKVGMPRPSPSSPHTPVGVEITASAAVRPSRGHPPLVATLRSPCLTRCPRRRLFSRAVCCRTAMGT